MAMGKALPGAVRKQQLAQQVPPFTYFSCVLLHRTLEALPSNRRADVFRRSLEQREVKRKRAKPAPTDGRLFDQNASLFTQGRM